MPPSRKLCAAKLAEALPIAKASCGPDAECIAPSRFPAIVEASYGFAQADR